MNISLILQMAADAEPERIGLVCEGRRWSYHALWRAAQGAGTSISKSGCSRVALLDESSEAAAIGLFGAAIAGVPYVPLNYRLADTDLAALLGRIAPAYLIDDVERIERLSPEGGHAAFSRATFVAGGPATRRRCRRGRGRRRDCSPDLHQRYDRSAQSGATAPYQPPRLYILGTTGWLDAEGYLFLAGRADDVIVRRGENISPGEIEEVLLSHSAIADAAAVGVPSTEWGEAVGIAVVARPNHTLPNDDELCALIRGRLRSSRVPERIAVLDALPYNELGKLLRREVRKLFKG